MLDRNQLQNGKGFKLVGKGDVGFKVIQQGSEISPQNNHQVLVQQQGQPAELMSITNLMADGVPA